MSTTGNKSLTFIAALICIVIYAAALVFGIGRVVVNYNSRTALAEQEFNEILDRASGAAVLGFMSRSYQEVIQQTLMDSQTILGVIISGSTGEFGFERQNGSIIEWFGNSARFKTGFGISKNPLYKGIWIEGQRNTTVRVIYSYIDYDLLIKTLKDTLFILLLVVAFAVFVLILELNMKPEPAAVPVRKRSQPAAPVSQPDESEYDIDFDDIPDIDDNEETPEAIPEPVFDDEDDEDETPKGLYSPRGIGWESYTAERLESELHRCASLEEDLVLIIIEAETADGQIFKKLAAEANKFFTQRDLIFEKGEQGITLIIPAHNLDQGFVKSEEFYGRIKDTIVDSSGVSLELCIGLSSRAGRLVDANRLIFEASQALTKAKEEPDSPIIAFRSDPEKYREFIRRKMKN